MGVFDGIGKALGAFGRVMDDAYMTYHRGPGWKEEQDFIERFQKIREETARVQLENSQEDQRLQREQAQRAAEAADRAAFNARMEFEQKAAAAGIGGLGGDLAGAPGSMLAGPPTEEVQDAFAAPPMKVPGLSNSPEAAMIGRSLGVREQEAARAKRVEEEAKIARALAKEEAAAQRQSEADARAAAADRRAAERHSWEAEDRSTPKPPKPEKPLTMREARDIAEANFDMPDGPERDANVDKLARRLFRESQAGATKPATKPASGPAGAAPRGIQQQQLPASVRIGGRSVPWAQVPPDVKREVLQRMGMQ
ncbi:MAG: hypothetical protein MUC67_04915 [Acidobacteria bacterium]|jgi:hypothetical protein|nr:hypothetical protein [Acidobacteriota bacterium]